MKTIFTLSFILMLSIMSMATPVDEIYKREYPSGQYISESQNRISDIRTKKEEAEQGRWYKENENNDWNKAEYSHTTSSYQKYLEKYSNGQYAAAAISRIQQLKRETKPKLNPIIHQLEQNMVYVKGGTFKMGCTLEQGGGCNDDAKAVHDVTLSSFYMGKYEVTQEEWREVIGGDPENSKIEGCARCPMEDVSWDDVQSFIDKLNDLSGQQYRLPTEAEWEYAARGGIKSKGFKYSGSNNMESVGWINTNSGSKTNKVGEKKPNELGLYDMSGNVCEWCSDWYDEDYYQLSSSRNPRGPSKGEIKVLRGGSWDHSAAGCRVSFRDSSYPSMRGYGFGFRLVRDL